MTISHTIRKVQLLIIGCSLIVGVFLRINYQDHIIRTPDERVFLKHTITLHEYGIRGGMHKNIERYITSPDDWFYPLPTRSGYHLLTYWTQKLVNNRSLETAIYVSRISSILAMMLCVWSAWYLYGLYGALLISALTATSPLSLAVSRRNWNESFMELSMMCLVFFSSVIAKKRTFPWYGVLGFFLIGSFTFAIKESAFLNVGLSALIPFFIFVYQREWKSTIKIALLSIVTSIAGIVLVLLLAGGINNFISVLYNARSAMPLNRYAADYQDGPMTDFLYLFYILSPGLCYWVIFGVLCYVTLWVVWQRERRIARDLGMMNSICTVSVAEDNLPVYSEGTQKSVDGDMEFFHLHSFTLSMVIGLFIVISSVPHYFINLRYLSPLYSLLPIFGAVPILILRSSKLTSHTYRRVVDVAVTLVVLVCVGVNIYTWRSIIIDKPRCFDLTVRLLKECGAVQRET